tara:strand:+ start:125 stop:268 length:144 start_codon:yes stop_codon:yes gene_type:complete
MTRLKGTGHWRELRHLLLNGLALDSGRLNYRLGTSPYLMVDRPELDR